MARKNTASVDNTFVEKKRHASFDDTLTLILSTIMGSSTDYVFAKDKDFRYLCCSPAFFKLTGIKKESDVIGKTDYQLFPENMADAFRRNDLALIKAGKPAIDFEETIYFSDGSLHYCLASKYILRDSEGTYVGTYGVSRDVTKEHVTFTQLQLINNGIPIGIATYSIKNDVLHLIYCNDGFCKLFGKNHADFETYDTPDSLDMVFEEDRPMIMEQIYALVDFNTPVDIKYRIHVKEGGYKWVNEKASTPEILEDSIRFNAIFFDISEQQATNEKLRISTEESNLAIQHGGNIVCRFDIKEKTLTISPDVAQKYSIPQIISGVPYEPIRQGLIAPESEVAYVSFFEAIMAGSRAETTIFQQHYQADWRWMEAKSTTIFSDDDTPVKAIISLFDVTEQLEQEKIYAKWLESMEERPQDSYTLFRCNLNRNTSYEIREGLLFTFDIDSLEGSFNERAQVYASQCIHNEDVDSYIAFANSDRLLAGYYRGKKSDVFEYRELLPDGISFRWIRLTVDLAEYPKSTDIEAYLMYEDINDKKEAEFETKASIETDALTGLLNRGAFEANVSETVLLSKPDQIHAMLMLDLDGFKLVNDIFGHGAGDEVLIDVAAQLKRVFRANDLVGRLGGDEFVVFVKNIPNDKIAAVKAQQVCDATRKKISPEVRISSSIGISFFPKDGKDFESLYLKADKALYYVKENGKNNYAFYFDNMTNGSENKLCTLTGNTKLQQNRTKRRMLIADDSELDCELLNEIFKEDFFIDVVHDGAAALSVIHKYGSALSVILLDLMMPETDGYAVLEIMKNDASGTYIPVIVITGCDERQAALKAISKGASEVVSKPINPEILRIRVSSAITKVENERLRVQNSILSMQNDEINSYNIALEQLGMGLVIIEWAHENYFYSPSMSKLLAGKFDNRDLWTIFDSDMVADAETNKKIQQLVYSMANDTKVKSNKTTVTLTSKSDGEKAFEFAVCKQVNEFGLTEQMIITIKDA